MAMTSAPLWRCTGNIDKLVPTLSTLVLQVLEGLEGAQAVGWPAFHKSSVHASPLLYDWDFDGVRDVLLATYDGQVLAFKDTVGLVTRRDRVNQR